MAAPATILTFNLIQGQFPSYGRRYADVTRPGDANQRFVYEGYRGDRVQLSARRYFAREADARAFGGTVQALQGSSVWLVDSLNSRSIAVFLHRVTFEALKRIEASDGNDWAVICTIDVQRTM
jgi:hypothetical protein